MTGPATNREWQADTVRKFRLALAHASPADRAAMLNDMPLGDVLVRLDGLDLLDILNAEQRDG